ncbi:hypothetical protein [Streptomyces umbrinus]|uniref:hypothetical protein n=1 Tax=Streptomyces umbrinus TaxID=67370 RepID=UPI0027D79F78|nr:hypothetical protein [Streptomyces umbrinus]
MVSAGGQPAQAAGSAAQDGTNASAKAKAKAKTKPPATVTLITGDRVDVDSDGRVVRLKRGKGREEIGFSVRREAGHTYALPQDALRPVADGVLDRKLFDVAQLVKGGYDDAHRTTLPLIVGYRKGGAEARASVGDPFAGVAVRERRALRAVDGEALETPNSVPRRCGRQSHHAAGRARDRRRHTGPAGAEHHALPQRGRRALVLEGRAARRRR